MSMTDTRPAPEAEPPRSSGPKPTSNRTTLVGGAAVLLVVVLLGTYLVNGRGSAAAEVEDTIRRAIQAENEGDVETFLALWTDDGLATYDNGTREEIQADPSILGRDEVVIVEFGDIEVDGDTATAAVDAALEPTVHRVNFELIREEGSWRINGWSLGGHANVPAGEATVELSLTDYAFDVTAGSLSDGFRGVRWTNIGAEEHEASLVRFTDDALTLESALEIAAETQDIPEGVEFVGFFGYGAPGGEGTSYIDRDLEAGRYAFVCMIPSEDGIPHAFKGMASEFTIG